MHPIAFTLIEVMAVVVILGLLAAATVFSLADEVQSAGRSDVIERLAHEDQLARLAARRTGAACVLEFDFDRQRLWRVDNLTNEPRPTHAWKLPDSCRIAQVLRSGDASTEPASPAPASAENGAAEVTFGYGGYAETYALRLDCKTAPPSGGRPDEQTVWLVFAGLTGQEMLLQNEDDVRKLLAALASPRPDAR